MRLPLNVCLLVFSLCTAMPLAAADSHEGCEKDVFVYLDVSKTMRTPRAGGVSRLDIFTRAVDDLLNQTSDFVGTGDRVRLVTFSGNMEVAFDDVIYGEALAALSAELMRIRGLQTVEGNSAHRATDVNLVLSDLQSQLRPRPAYVIIASDLIHDPENENEANQPARIEGFLQRLRDFHRATAPERLPHTIILDANVGGDPDAVVGRRITEELAKPPLKARSIPVIGVGTVAPQLKRHIAAPVIVTVGFTGEGSNAHLGLKLKNPNPFPVRLLQTKVGDQATPVDRLIGCGATETIAIAAAAGATITAEFNFGDSAKADVVDLLDIEATRARVLLDGLRNETLLLHATIRKVLTEDAEVDVHVGGEVRKVSIGKGTRAGSVTFAIPLPADAPELRGDPTVHARFSVDRKIVLQNATTSGNVASREAEAKSHGDWRDQIPRVIHCMVVFLIAWLIPARGLVRRIFSASMDADVLDLLPGPERFFNAALTIGLSWLPTYVVSGAQWAAYVNALPMALLAAMFVFYLLRFGSLIVWWRYVEPKGEVLPPSTARRRLRSFTIAIWTCTLATFFGVTFSMASLVADVLVAAT